MDSLKEILLREVPVSKAYWLELIMNLLEAKGNIKLALDVSKLIPASYYSKNPKAIIRQILLSWQDFEYKATPEFNIESIYNIKFIPKADLANKGLLQEDEFENDYLSFLELKSLNPYEEVLQPAVSFYDNLRLNVDEVVFKKQWERYDKFDILPCRNKHSIRIPVRLSEFILFLHDCLLQKLINSVSQQNIAGYVLHRGLVKLLNRNNDSNFNDLEKKLFFSALFAGYQKIYSLMIDKGLYESGFCSDQYGSVVDLFSNLRKHHKDNNTKYGGAVMLDVIYYQLLLHRDLKKLQNSEGSSLPLEESDNVCLKLIISHCDKLLDLMKLQGLEARAQYLQIKAAMCVKAKQPCEAIKAYEKIKNVNQFSMDANLTLALLYYSEKQPHRAKSSVLEVDRLISKGIKMPGELSMHYEAVKYELRNVRVLSVTRVAEKTSSPSSLLKLSVFSKRAIKERVSAFDVDEVCSEFDSALKPNFIAI